MIDSGRTIFLFSFLKNFYYQMMRAFPLSNLSTLNRRGFETHLCKTLGGKVRDYRTF